MIDLTVTVSAWPWAEISQSLSHVIGGFPAVFLPMLIYGEFLESSYEPLALSHRSLDLPIAVISVFVECWEASGTARVLCFQHSEGLSLQPLPGTGFFFETAICLSLHFRSTLSPNVSEESLCLPHQFSLRVHLLPSDEGGVVASLRATRWSLHLRRVSPEQGLVRASKRS